MSVERGTLTRLSMQRLSRRFSRNKEYNKVDDVNDTRVPLHNEDAFQHGLKFKAKFIGTLEIARPQSKIDIITAMRRIRYEYKVKGIKKQRCLLDISTKGVKVTKRKRRRKEQNDDELIMMQHPVYRIFYVSHDSQDLKIFSYITRESSDNSFQCNVFKAYKKRMALHVVRSLGQAFDVCHKQNPRPKKKKSNSKENGEKDKSTEKKDGDETAEGVKEPSPQDNGDDGLVENTAEADKPATNNTSDDPFLPAPLANGNPPLINFDPFAPLAPPPPVELQIANVTPPAPIQPPYVSRPRPKPGQSTIQENPLAASNDSLSKLQGMSPSVSLGEPINDTDGGVAKNQWDAEKKLVSAQVTQLMEQLHMETQARIEAQARVDHLLLQNKELLSHLQKMMVQLQQLQTLQMNQQQNSASSASSPPPKNATVPDSAQTPPTTEPDDSLSEISEQKPTDASHDTSNDQSIVSDSAPDQSKADSNQSNVNFDEAFNEDNKENLFEDPFKSSTDDTPTDTPSHNKEILDAAFTPIAT